MTRFRNACTKIDATVAFSAMSEDDRIALMRHVVAIQQWLNQDVAAALYAKNALARFVDD